MNVSRKIQKARQANAAHARSVRTQSASMLEVAKAMFEKPQPVYVTDSKGREVRSDKVNPATAEDVSYLLKGNRVVTEDEVLHDLGAGWMKYMLRNSYLVRDEVADYYWVTQRAAEVYHLGDLRIAGVKVVYKAA